MATDRRWYRFSVGALLFLMFCLCGLFAGYRVGYLEGKSGGVKARLILKTYPVADLLRVQPSGAATVSEFDTLTDAIYSTVAPESWQANGPGEGVIKPYAANLSLIIAQTDDVHQQVAAMLGALRQTQRAAANRRNKTKLNG